MAILHVLIEPAAVASCLAAAAADDRILLVGDGVYAAAEMEAAAQSIGALREDAEARGVPLRDVPALADADFVAWAAATDASVTWR